MKKNLAVFFLILILASGTIVAQTRISDTSSYLKEYYVGGLFSIGAKGLSTSDATPDISFRLGSTFEIPISDNLKIHNKWIYEPKIQSFKTDLRFIYQLPGTSARLLAGFMPTSTRMIFIPNAVSHDNHFLPSAKKVISPNSRLGVMLTDNTWYGGVYANAKDSLEINCAADFNLAGNFFERIKIGAYCLTNQRTLDNQIIGGAALYLKFWRINFTLFEENNKVDIQSLHCGFDCGSGWSVYNTTVVFSDNSRQQEAGILKEMTNLTNLTMVHYLLGFGYRTQPTVGGYLYIQAWL